MLGAGHDAWAVGNEPVVVIDFQGMVDYAKQNQTSDFSYPIPALVWQL